MLDNERTGRDRRSRPGSFRDRLHLAERDKVPPTEEERAKGDRRRRPGDLQDRAHLRRNVQVPQWVAYVVLGVGMLAVIWAWQHQQDSIRDGRVKTTREFCKVLNENAKAANRNTDYIEGLIVAGAALPGDRVVRKDKAGLPLQIEPGGLSHFLRRYGYPTPAERLNTARVTVRGIHERRIPAVDCKAAVERVKHGAG